MFVAWRDLRHARGRFALMTSVVTLITLLVAFLAALAAGLGRGSTSAIVDLPADRIALAANGGEAPSFTQSQLTAEQWHAWADVDGVSWASPLGVVQTRATDGTTTAAVTALGVEPGSALAPSGDLAAGRTVLSAGAAAALDAAVGDTLSVGSQQVVVAAVTGTDADFAHTPALWLSLDDWQPVGAHAGSTGAVATAVALGLAPHARPADLDTADATIGTTTMTLSGARDAISSYAAEHLSLTMMQVFLLVVSALVVGVFFTVWTVDRGHDVAVVKALGGSDGYLLRDAIGQAAVVLAVGTAVGAALAALVGSVLQRVMPVLVSPGTVVVPAVLIGVLGLVGAAVAVVRIARVDPHDALASR